MDCLAHATDQRNEGRDPPHLATVVGGGKDCHASPVKRPGYPKDPNVLHYHERKEAGSQLLHGPVEFLGSCLALSPLVPQKSSLTGVNSR